MVSDHVGQRKLVTILSPWDELPRGGLTERGALTGWKPTDLYDPTEPDTLKGALSLPTCG